MIERRVNPGQIYTTIYMQMEWETDGVSLLDTTVPSCYYSDTAARETGFQALMLVFLIADSVGDGGRLRQNALFQRILLIAADGSGPDIVRVFRPSSLIPTASDTKSPPCAAAAGTVRLAVAAILLELVGFLSCAF